MILLVDTSMKEDQRQDPVVFEHEEPQQCAAKFNKQSANRVLSLTCKA